jgi:hypothetical protein
VGYTRGEDIQHPAPHVEVAREHDDRDNEEATFDLAAVDAELERRGATAVREALGTAARPADTTTPAATPREETATMTPEMGIMGQAAEEIGEAATRAAGSQLLKLVRENACALLCRHLGADDPALRARVAAFLATDIGTAALAATLSLALTTLPAGAGDLPRVLARELRVRALGDTADVVADLLLEPLRAVSADFLRGTAPLAAVPAALPDGARADGVVDLAAVGVARGGGR